MFKPRPIFISLSPNTLPADIRLAARVVSMPWQWRGYSKKIPAIQSALERQVGLGGATLTSSGRAALYEALVANKIGAGDEVLLQTFTCLAVPAAITWSGATPVYVDIDPATFNLNPARIEAAITPRTRALIIQHTFGIPAPLVDILPLARKHNLLVIEDLAHALGGSLQGQPLGSFGDITILSFGRDKTISSVFGGAILARDPAVRARYTEKRARYSPPSTWWAIQQLLHPLLINALLPWYFRAHVGKGLLYLAQRLGLLSLAVTKEEKTTGAKPSFVDRSFHPALVPLLTNQLEQLPAFTRRRRAIAERYLTELGGSPYLTSVVGESNWLRFPVWVNDRRAILTAAKRERMLLGDWYSSPVAPATLNQQSLTHYVPGSCPEAERAAAHVINLPTHPRLADSDVERVIQFIKKYISTSPPTPLL